MKYIPADKLIAEIKRQIEETKSMKPSFDQFWAGQISAFKGAIKIAESLQQEQPEVDLAEEITRFFSKNPIPHEHITDWPLLKNTAIHFYELGLNARMEKPNGVNGVVHHALKSHWIVTDKNKLAAILKAFPEGAEVELFICAKK